MARIQWTKKAENAFAAIVLDRRQRVGFVAARALRQNITDCVHLLRDFPQLGRPRSNHEEGRELVVPPYVIPYQIVDDTVFIIDITHARSAHSDKGADEIKSRLRRRLPCSMLNKLLADYVRWRNLAY